ncbi:MAG: hypothetical protein CM15mP12_8260 [Gammaproteobacteria bacterium]|nr:MAG: hypothetical protein CM15mP12_8260 [Gammaproteobacteria bacterium]
MLLKNFNFEWFYRFGFYTHLFYFSLPIIWLGLTKNLFPINFLIPGCRKKFFEIKKELVFGKEKKSFFFFFIYCLRMGLKKIDDLPFLFFLGCGYIDDGWV